LLTTGHPPAPGELGGGATRRGDLGFGLALKRHFAWMLVLLFAATCVAAQEPTQPLKPPDLSSPRATLKTFLESTDDLALYLAHDYLPAPSREKFGRAAALGNRAVQTLDLSDVPPAARVKAGRAAGAALYEVLSRVALPVFDEIPDAAQMGLRPGTQAKRWVIPDTEIALVRMESGPRAGEFLFVSGQIPIDPATGALIEGDVRVQARRVLENLRAIVAESGASFDRVVKTTVYLVDMNDFPALNEEYATFFGTPPPARATVQVGRLPKDVRVEIDAIVYLG